MSALPKTVLIVDRHDVVSIAPDGKKQVVARSAQEQSSSTDHVGFTDPQGRLELFAITRRAGAAGIIDVVAREGIIATFGKEGGTSPLGLTYTIATAAGEFRGCERRSWYGTARSVAAVGAVSDVTTAATRSASFIPVHLDYTDAAKRPVMRIEHSFPSRYFCRVTILEPTLDWRVAAAQAMAIDRCAGY